MSSRDLTHKLGEALCLGHTSGPDKLGVWRTDLGTGRVLVFWPSPDGVGWYMDADGRGEATGSALGDDAMVKVVRDKLEAAGRIYHG